MRKTLLEGTEEIIKQIQENSYYDIEVVEDNGEEFKWVARQYDMEMLWGDCREKLYTFADELGIDIQEYQDGMSMTILDFLRLKNSIEVLDTDIVTFANNIGNQIELDTKPTKHNISGKDIVEKISELKEITGRFVEANVGYDDYVVNYKENLLLDEGLSELENDDLTFQQSM